MHWVIHDFKKIAGSFACGNFTWAENLQKQQILLFVCCIMILIQVVS